MNDDIIIQPCKFCQQDVLYRPIEELEHLGVKVYFCYDCSAEYLYWGSDSIDSVSIYTTYRERMYRWTVISGGTSAHLWYIKTPGVPGSRKNEDMELIKTFKEDLPIITPDNFIEKLSVYLLFI